MYSDVDITGNWAFAGYPRHATAMSHVGQVNSLLRSHARQVGICFKERYERAISF